MKLDFKAKIFTLDHCDPVSLDKSDDLDKNFLWTIGVKDGLWHIERNGSLFLAPEDNTKTQYHLKCEDGNEWTKKRISHVVIRNRNQYDKATIAFNIDQGKYFRYYHSIQTPHGPILA